MEISNLEADVLETQAKLEKMLMIFVISTSKLTETARSGDEVRGAYSDRLLVSPNFIWSGMLGAICSASTSITFLKLHCASNRGHY